jgi:hypothetical protein
MEKWTKWKEAAEWKAKEMDEMDLDELLRELEAMDEGR